MASDSWEEKGSKIEKGSRSDQIPYDGPRPAEEEEGRKPAKTSSPRLTTVSFSDRSKGPQDWEKKVTSVFVTLFDRCGFPIVT